MEKYVEIYYGPVKSFELHPEHKPQFLNGIKNKLIQMGFRVSLKPTDYINQCTIIVCENVVFRCNIKNLGFNLAYEHNKVCMRAVQAVWAAMVKLRYAALHIWCWKHIEKSIFQSGAENWWPKKEDSFQKMNRHEDCARCCKILHMDTKDFHHLEDPEMLLTFKENKELSEKEQEILAQYSQGLEIVYEERESDVDYSLSQAKGLLLTTPHTRQVFHGKQSF